MEQGIGNEQGQGWRWELVEALWYPGAGSAELANWTQPEVGIGRELLIGFIMVPLIAYVSTPTPGPAFQCPPVF